MAGWGVVIPISVGGLVAVGFLDEERVIVGSHSGLGVFDAGTGTRLERIPAEDYGWYQGDPPYIRWATADAIKLVPAEGLWGGALSRSTLDGWSAHLLTDGVELLSEGKTALVIHDAEERRAWGFSPEGRIFVYATSATLNLVSRR